MTRHDFVLAALAASEGAWHSPSQVEKLFFLLDQNIRMAYVGGPYFDFHPGDYGPSDPAVFDQLRELADEGSVEARYDASSRYTSYRTTYAGQQAGERMLLTLPSCVAEEIRRLSSLVRGLSFTELVSQVGKKYPEMQVNSVFGGQP